MNRGVWPAFRNKENEVIKGRPYFFHINPFLKENIPVPTSSDSKWRSTEQDTQREYRNMLVNEVIITME